MTSPSKKAEQEELDASLLISRPVIGLDAVLSGHAAPLPYPVNVYQLGGDDSSGLTGTLMPDGTYIRLVVAPPPRATRWWEDACACFRYGTAVWNGNIAGSIWIDPAMEEPHQRLWDASLTGDWPDHPPVAGRLVSVEGARAAAAEKEKDAREELR